MGKSFYTGTDAEMYTGGTTFASKIATEYAALGLTNTQVTAFAAANSAYGTAYEVALNPDSRTRSAVATKNQKKAALKKMASDYASIINGTPTVTDAQKIDLGLSVRKTPTPVPPPSDRPDVSIVSVVGRNVKIRVRATADATKRSKPAGVQAAWCYTFVGTSYPSDPGLWTFNGATTKSDFDIVFPNDIAAGAQVWICCAWINSKQIAGPVSIPVTTNVQTGGVGAVVMKMAA